MGDRNRVLVLNHFAAPRGQAGGTRHVELFSRLSGWDHLIIASDLNPQTGQRVDSEPGFAVVAVPPYSSNGVRRILNWLAYASRAFLLGIRQRKVDVVYGSSPHLLAAAAAWLIAALRRTPFVLEVRDLWPQVLVEMGALSTSSRIFHVLSALESFLYARADAIVVMAEGSRTALLDRGIDGAKIHYIPNGADAEDFVPSAPRDVLRERYGFTTFTAVYTGAHGPANGLDQLLDAAIGVKDLDLAIVLVGGGVSKAKLLSRVQDENLANVRFLEPIPKSEIPDLLAAADLGLHVLADVALFQTAVSPNKVFDYMAAGLPILTNCPGLVADTVQTSGSGWSVQPAELDVGLRQALSANTGTDSLRAVEGLRGQRWLAANQSRAAMCERLSMVMIEASRRKNGKQP